MKDRTSLTHWDIRMSMASLGILIGLLVGMSTSPVVASLTGTLAALAVAMITAGLGLRKPQSQSTSQNEPMLQFSQRWPVGTISLFCLFMILGVFSGLYIRTHDLMSPSIEERIQWYTDANFPHSEARDIISGMVKDNSHNDTSRHDSSLKSGKNIDILEELNPSEFLDASEALHAWNVHGGDFEKEIVKALEDANSSDSDVLLTLEAVWKAFKNSEKGDD